MITSMAAKTPEKVVICGGGIQAAVCTLLFGSCIDIALYETYSAIIFSCTNFFCQAIAYYLSLRGVKSTVVERCEVACAASGKAGSFILLFIHTLSC